MHGIWLVFEGFFSAPSVSILGHVLGPSDWTVIGLLLVVAWIGGLCIGPSEEELKKEEETQARKRREAYRRGE